MHRPGWPQTRRVPQLMSTFRLERRRIQAAREWPQNDPRALMIVAAVCFVFVCTFAVGRVTRGSSNARAEPTSSLLTAPADATVPARLTVVPPIQLEAPPKPAAPVRRSAPSVQLVAPTVASRPSTPAPAQAPPAPATPVVRTPVTPAPSATPPAAPRPSTPSSGGSSGGARTSPPAGGGGSFESSG
jgi:hypothetical protein